MQSSKQETFTQLPNTTQYIPKTTYINITALTNSPFYSCREYEDAIYYGEIKENMRNGYGAMTYHNGRYYEGEWKQDFRHGRGYEHYLNKNIYEGEFAQGKAHGKGVYKWSNGEIYDGEWKEGLKHGDGVWKGIHGDSYIGEWKNSKADGYGVHIWANGDRYEGEWKECLKHGNGTDIFTNGDMYIGQYKLGKPNGFGQYIWKNGATYAGEFKDGLKHGQGKWRKSKEQETHIYEGQYVNDKKEGYGIFKWASGNVYRGVYKNDERDGIGEMRWTDGSVYLGQWNRGIQHGYGKMIFPDGTIKEGYFDNNIYKEDYKVSKVDIPAELQDKSFNITTLDPIKNKSSNAPLILPSIGKQNLSFEAERKKTAIGSRKRESRGKVAKSSMANRPPRNADYKSQEGTINRKSTNSSRTNITIDSGLKKAESVDMPRRKRKIRIVKKKKQAFWVPNGSNILASFNKGIKPKVAITKKI